MPWSRKNPGARRPGPRLPAPPSVEEDGQGSPCSPQADRRSRLSPRRPPGPWKASPLGSRRSLWWQQAAEGHRLVVLLRFRRLLRVLAVGEPSAKGTRPRPPPGFPGLGRRHGGPTAPAGAGPALRPGLSHGKQDAYLRRRLFMDRTVARERIRTRRPAAVPSWPLPADLLIHRTRHHVIPLPVQLRI